MPSCETRYFGATEYENNDAIVFPSGLPGFPAETRFLVLQRPAEYPVVYLQSTTTAALCFLAIPIPAIEKDYLLRLSPEEAATLGTTEEPRVGADVLCLALVVVRESGPPTANLFAPIVINLASHTGAQCFNTAGAYSHQHPLLPAEEGVAA
jgi:flagellar assembly factor FliW